MLECCSHFELLKVRSIIQLCVIEMGGELCGGMKFDKVMRVQSYRILTRLKEDRDTGCTCVPLSPCYTMLSYCRVLPSRKPS